MQKSSTYWNMKQGSYLSQLYSMAVSAVLTNSGGCYISTSTEIWRTWHPHTNDIAEKEYEYSVRSTGPLLNRKAATRRKKKGCMKSRRASQRTASRCTRRREGNHGSKDNLFIWLPVGHTVSKYTRFRLKSILKWGNACT